MNYTESSNKPKIIVLGSSNMDMVIHTSHFPAPGETILGGDFSLVSGGKGANQAVAAARLGGEVTFITSMGADSFGMQNLENYKFEGIDTSFVKLSNSVPTGIALITVDKLGENTIIVASGANTNLSPKDLTPAIASIKNASYLLLQLEIPIETVLAAATLAKSLDTKVILNPAPASALPDDLFKELFLITPNETEAEALTGIKINDATTARAASEILINRGVQQVVITLGPMGAYLYSEQFKGIVPAKNVIVKDTTAAGDTFNGALAVALGSGQTLLEAVHFAVGAASLSVQRAGAQTSIPYLYELIALKNS